MNESPATFSESWYRVANQRIGLRAAVKVSRHNFRGERWIVLENPFSNQFFRLRPAAYEFVARLHPKRTVEEVWRETFEKAPDDAPGQEAVIQLLGQLYHANLLQYHLADDAVQLFKRYERARQREKRSWLMNIMSVRIPLFDPDRFLIRTLPFVSKLISPVGALLWLAVVIGAVKVCVDHFDALQERTQSVLAAENLPLLYLGLILIKTLHEFGHAYFCRRFGGEVHVMGVMLLIFTPVPYMDATSSWGFRSRWKRMLVGGAGMIVEIFVAGLCAFVWANTGQGVVHNLAYNMMFVASVSTLVFNINPLLRYDGYYMLSDLLEIPNLHQRASEQLRFLAERFLFRLPKAESPALTRREAAWLTVFGISSTTYRLFVFGAILLFIADRYLLLGMLMALVCLVTWVVVPLVKLFRYLATSPRLARHRGRSVFVTVGVIATLVLLLQYLPLPHHFRAPGVLRTSEWTQVFNDAPGRVNQVLVKSGTRVVAGQPLVELSNSEVEIELAAALATEAEIQARLRHAMQEQIANLKPLTSRLESVRLRLKRIREDQKALIVKAAQEGIWVVPRPEEFSGRWLERGTEIGLIVEPSKFRFIATVAQEDVDRLFADGISGAEVRLFGQSATAFSVEKIHVVPAEKKELPSPALGWAGGGEVRIASNDPKGRTAAEPFFEVRMDIGTANPSGLWHGRTGKARFNLQPEPLLPRCRRALYQLLQKRYQL